MTDPTITIYPVSSADAPLTCPLGDGTAEPKGGSNWEIIDRPQRKGLTHWSGMPPATMTVPIMLDGFIDDRSVEPHCEYLARLERPRDPISLPIAFSGTAWTQPRPTVFRVDGPLPLTQLHWVLEELEPTGEIRSITNGMRVRASFVLHLLEFVDVDLLIEASPAKSAVDRNRRLGDIGAGLSSGIVRIGRSITSGFG